MCVIIKIISYLKETKSITAFLILVAYYGTEAYAAYGIGVQILSFSFVIKSMAFNAS